MVRVQFKKHYQKVDDGITTEKLRQWINPQNEKLLGFLSIQDHFLALVYLSERPVLQNTDHTELSNKFITD